MNSQLSSEVNSFPATKFLELEELTPEQFKAYFPKFVESTQNSILKTSRGELAPVSDAEIKERLQSYFQKKSNV